MEEKLRRSGIDIIGDISWGTHFCQFYQTKEDLTDILVPYFKAGLENNEFCMWVTSQPLDAEEAKEALRKAVFDFDIYLEKGQIEIIPYTHWYVKEGVFDSERVLNGWVEKLNHALANGYDGLRLTGNTFWLEKKDWNDFVDYEEEVDRVLGNYRMIAICTYCLDRCSATEIIDVVINHQFALIKREGKWEQIESSKRKKAEEAALQAAKDWGYTFDAMPDLIVLLDTEYRIVRANRAMAAKLEVTPEECVGLTCYRAVHGTDEPPSFCPHRQLLKDGVEYTTEVCEDCLGGYFLVSVSPLHDSKGNLIGSVHVARDITERKQAEEALRQAYEDIQVQSEELHVQSEELQKANEALRESEERFRTLAENSPDVIARFDRQNRHLYANPAVTVPYGHSPEEIIGKTHSELGMDPEKVKFWEEHHENVFTTGKPETMEFRYISPQEKEYYFNTRIVPEFVDGEVTSVLAISRDITDIKAAETKLKEARDNLKKLVEKRTMKLRKAYKSLKESEKGLAEAQKMAHLGNWDWNIVTNGLYWSDEIYRIFGRKPQEFGATYDAFLSYVHPDDRDYVNNAVIEALDGKLYSIDHRIILANGEERIVHEQGEVIFDKENVPVQMKGTVQDITEHKKTQKALELANAYNRSLIEASVDPLVTIGLDGKITDVNNSTESVTGYSRKDLIGTDFSDYFTEPEKARQGYQHVFQEGLVRDYPLEIRHKDGHITPVLYNASVYRDETGEVIGVFAAARDVTELKKAEKELQLASKYNRSLIETSLDPLVTIGPDGKITDVNEATESVTGYSRKELIGTDFSNYFTEPEKAKEGYKQVFREGLVRDYALEIRHRDGHITPVLYNASVYRDEDGEVIGIFAAARDITERKKAEEKIQTLANVVESSDDAIITKSLDGIITSWNKGAEQIYGYSAEEILGKHISILEPPLFVGETKKLVRMIKHGEKIRHYETSRLRKDGMVINVSITLSPVFDNYEKLTATSIIARDITERKKAEEELQKKEERYRIVTEQTGQLLYDYDLRTDTGNWAGNIEKVTGYPPQEFKGLSSEAWIDNIHPEDRKCVLKRIHEIRKKGGNYGAEFRFRKKDGTYLHAEDSGVYLVDEAGLPYRALGVIKDITEKKLAAKKLKVSEERIQSYLQNFRGIGTQLDKNLFPIFLHGAVEELTGYTKEDFLSGKILWNEIVEPEDLPGLQEKLQKMKSTPNMTVRHEYRIRRKNEEVRWINGIAQNISGSGNKELYQGMMSDITDRKIAEESLNKMERIRKKEIHHRIKNNLQVISSLLDLQAEHFDDKKVKEAFRDSQNRVISMALIHEELYESGEIGTLNFAAYLQKLSTDLFRCYNVGDLKAHLLLDLEEDTFLDMDTAVPLGIIVNELVSNSLKHAFPDREKGMVKIKLCRKENGECESNKVENTKEDNNSTSFVLTISDNGMGMPESVNPENSDTLGIQLVTLLVDQLDGGLELKRDCGTEFIIKIAIEEKQ